MSRTGGLSLDEAEHTIEKLLIKVLRLEEEVKLLERTLKELDTDLHQLAINEFDDWK